MLTQLKIKNLALVDALEWNLDGGLVGVTGETGAGKSVIVGALKLVLGSRADKGLIRTGESQCAVEAVFLLPDPGPVNDLLAASGLEVCEDNLLIIRRVISASGNRQFVNNSAATLSVLKSLGGGLVDLHGPHDHQSLLSPERQMTMLDAYAGAAKESQNYRQAWRAWKKAQDEWQSAREQREISDQEKELLRYQLEEIDEAEIKPGEEADLEERYQRASNSAKLQDLAVRALGALPELDDLQRSISELSRIDGSLEDLGEEANSAVLQLGDVQATLQEYLENLAQDGAETQEVEARVNLFETLKRKYGPNIDDVLTHAEQARQKLENSENREEFLLQLQQKSEAALDDLRAVGKKLTAKRKRKASSLAREIRRHLVDLGFKQSEFEVALTTLSSPQITGFETVDYLFGPNPGEPLKPLRLIGSSGEISRVMLAVKNALADQDQTPLMVFDEIDANVGGEIARAVGEKMASLGERHQVVSITHFPQVAAVAHQHFVVKKFVKDGRTLSSLTQVEGDDRISELVRMLGGGTGAEAHQMARSLLPKK